MKMVRPAQCAPSEKHAGAPSLPGWGLSDQGLRTLAGKRQKIGMSKAPLRLARQGRAGGMAEQAVGAGGRVIWWSPLEQPERKGDVVPEEPFLFLIQGQAPPLEGVAEG